MNRTIPAPKPDGDFWPVMLGHMVPGKDIPYRRLKTINYPDGLSIVNHRKLQTLTPQQREMYKTADRQSRMMDLNDEHKKLHPVLSQLMQAMGLGGKQGQTPVAFERFKEDLSWRGATQNRVR